MSSAGRCLVCATLTPEHLIDLDLLLADPARWPSTVYGLFDPPKGGLPASYRRHGAVNMGMAWLEQHGYADRIGPGALRRHYRYDVPVVDANVDTLVHRGIVARQGNRTRAASVPDPLDPAAFMRYYDVGIKLGIQGLELLTRRIQTLLDEQKEVPLALLKQIVDTGAKLAMSQAAIQAAGKPWRQDEDDENEGFRVGAGEPSPRIGHTRVRVVGDERIPVPDEGPADRRAYSEAAREAGRTDPF